MAGEGVMLRHAAHRQGVQGAFHLTHAAGGESHLHRVLGSWWTKPRLRGVTGGSPAVT